MWIITLVYGNRVDSWQSENPEEDLKAVSWSGTLKSVTVKLAPAYEAWSQV